MPHTADVAVAIAAPTLRTLFDAAAEALLEVVGGTASEAGAGAVRGAARETATIRVRGASREDLLVRWLQELLYRQESGGRRFGAARVVSIDPRRLVLRGVARAGTPGPARRAAGREVKAVTYHRLAILRRAGRWRTRLVFDV